MNVKTFLMVLCLVAVLLSGAFVSVADAAVPITNEPLPPNSLVPDRGNSEPTISRRQASDLARQNFDGRVLSIRQDRNKWRVRMDKEGTVFNVFVNTSSGAVSRSSD